MKVLSQNGVEERCANSFIRVKWQQEYNQTHPGFCGIEDLIVTFKGEFCNRSIRFEAETSQQGIVSFCDWAAGCGKTTYTRVEGRREKGKGCRHTMAVHMLTGGEEVRAVAIPWLNAC